MGMIFILHPLGATLHPIAPHAKQSVEMSDSQEKKNGKH